MQSNAFLSSFIGLASLAVVSLPFSTTRGDETIALASASYKVVFTGHSFAGAPANWLGLLATQAKIAGYENLGRQAIGASRVIDHWRPADERNLAKRLLREGKVDFLTLSPNMQLPDEGIDLFVDLALEKRPDVHVIVQGSWMTWDGLGKDGIVNAQRDERPVAEIRERTLRHMEEIRTQLRAVNTRVGRNVCRLVPVGLGVVRLRELVAEGKLPGFERPSQLFYDDIGHGKPPIHHLCTYMFFAAVFQRDPRGLPGLGSNGWTKDQGAPAPELTPLLQRIAWETMQAEPLSGLPASAR